MSHSLLMVAALVAAAPACAQTPRRQLASVGQNVTGAPLPVKINSARLRAGRYGGWTVPGAP